MNEATFKPIADFKISDYKKGDTILLSNNGIYTDVVAWINNGYLMEGFNKIDPENYDFFMPHWSGKP
jgi:hypothetical protein